MLVGRDRLEAYLPIIAVAIWRFEFSMRLYLQRGSEHHLGGGTTKSYACAIGITRINW